MKKAEKIYRAVDELVDACARLNEFDLCNESCPLHCVCLEDTTVEEFNDLVTEDMITEFIEVSESAEPTIDRWDYEADEWNLRRGDPDDI